MSKDDAHAVWHKTGELCMRKHLLRGLALWSTLLVTSVAFAQEQKTRSAGTDDQSLRVAVDLVLLDVGVTDKEGRSVRDLGRDNFKVYEDKVEQTISYFSTEESPVTWGVVVDRSGSMRDMEEVYDAALHMINEGVKEDEMFVMTFSRQIDTLSDHTADRRILRDALFGLHAQGATALWDAVDSAIDYLKRGKHRKKALLVITDGVDNKSRLGFRHVLDRIRESDLIVYTVGINTPTGTFAKGRRERDQLEQLAEVTGGYAHFPTDSQKCRETMEEIVRQVSEHYTIGYYPTNATYDGKWRKIKVAVDSRRPGEKYVARTRTGYSSIGSAR
jgi:Ca-activated chloride channel family protein